MPHGQRVLLRKLASADLEKLLEWDDDPRVTQYIGKRFDPDDDGNSWLSQTLSDSRNMVFIIEYPKGRAIGSIQLLDISWRRKTAEMRIFIGIPDLWGRGLGTEAIGLLISLLMREWSFRQLYLRVDPENRRARRAYEKCGFRRVGIVDAGNHAEAGRLVLMTLNLHDHAGVPAS